MDKIVWQSVTHKFHIVDLFNVDRKWLVGIISLASISINLPNTDFIISNPHLFQVNQKLKQGILKRFKNYYEMVEFFVLPIKINERI